MKRFTVLAILCIALTLLAGCDFLVKTGTLTGVVTDEVTGQPIAGALVNIWNKNVTTDAAGQYIVKVKSGKFIMKVEHAEYIAKTANVTITGDQETQQNFALDYAMVVGIVSDSQGGGPIDGATVTWKDQTVTTDANGNFQLKIKVGEPSDLLVTKEGRATTRVQDLDLATLSRGFHKEIFEVPMRKPNSPYKSSDAPTVELEVKNAAGEYIDVTTGMELTGNLTFKETVTGPNDVYVMYAWVGTMQRGPRDLYQSDVASAEWTLNSTLIPNGPTYIRVLAYDSNENAVMRIIPVVINNAANDQTVPANLAILRTVSYSFGKNLGFYNESQAKGKAVRVPEVTLPDGEKFTPNIAAPGANMYVKLTWGAAQGADGYKVYRSIGNDDNYKLIGYTKAASYDDYSSQLVANTEIYYNVVPYNSKGDSQGIVRVAYLLPSFNVMLETPANESVDVELSPTFTWDLNASGEFPVDTWVYNQVYLWDATDYKIWDTSMETEFDTAEKITEQFSTEYPATLQPGAVYSWDVYISWADYLPYFDADGYSYSLTYSGEYYIDDAGNLVGTGSANGEAVFTTQLQ